MKQKTLLTKAMFLLFALIAGSSSVWAQTVLFHETFGDNSGSARVWSDAYSAKSGVSGVYEEAVYAMTNVKQGKNTTGSTASGLNQSTKNEDAVFIVGPLNVAGYNGLTLNYKWNAASIKKNTYFTSASYATSVDGEYTTITTYGNTEGATSAGATSFIDCSYDIPASACVSTLYLKIVFNTSNTQAIIDEVDLSCEGPSLPVSFDYISVATMSIATCTYNKPIWKNSDNNDYTFGNGSTELPTKAYSGDELIKVNPGTYNVTVPAGITVSKIAITGKSSSADGTPITVGTVTQTIKNSIATAYFSIASPSAGASISITTETKEFGLQSIVLYTSDGKTLNTTANMDGWRAFYDADASYTADANTTVYVVRKKSATANTVTLTEYEGGIPKGTPVILKTTAADHKITLTKATVADFTGDNLLKVTTTGANLSTGVYRLGYGAEGVGFYNYTSASAPAGVVYIETTNVTAAAGAPVLTIEFDGDGTTGISTIETAAPADGIYYDLQGRRVVNPTKGLYIVNGKKVIIK